MDEGQPGAAIDPGHGVAPAADPGQGVSATSGASAESVSGTEGKAARKAARAQRKAAAKAAKKAARAERKAAAKAAKKAARAERKAAAKAAKKAARAERKAADDVADTAAGTSAWVRVPVDASRTVAAMAGGVLEEVADLVRKAAEPAAARIVERVGRQADGPPAEAVGAASPAADVPIPATKPPEAPADAATPERPEPSVETRPEVPAAVTAAPSEPAPAPEPVPSATPGPGSPSADLGVPLSAAPGAMIGAAIDVGANSAHLLVAAAGGHRVEPLLDESVFLGLGDRVGERGLIGADARAELVEALVGYAATARRLGARDLTVMGTEPVRRAADAAALVHALEVEAGVALHVLRHDEEAMLTLLGVTLGRPVRSELLVVDIGGGSCELVHATPDGAVHAAGIALGSAHLTRDLVHADPPTLAEIETLRTAARSALAEAPDVTPSELIAVGGTASNLLRLMPSTALDRVLTRRRITVALAMLTVQRSAEAAERHLLRPQRARILPAGAVIVDAILERYGMDRLRVVEEGIREGAVLAAAAAGPSWRDRLPELVRGWRDEGPRLD